MRTWLNVELDKDIAEKFREWCFIERDKGNGFRFQTSEADNLIHFDCYIDTDECRRANQFIDTLEKK